MSHADPRTPQRPQYSALVLALLCGIATSGCSRTAETAPADPAASSQFQDTSLLEAGASAVPDFQRYMLGDLPESASAARDPFGSRGAIAREVPAPTRPAAVAPPALRGIVRSEGRLVALFDRGAGAEGDTVSGWRVVEIEARAVVIERQSRRLRISL